MKNNKEFNKNDLKIKGLILDNKNNMLFLDFECSPKDYKYKMKELQKLGTCQKSFINYGHLPVCMNDDICATFKINNYISLLYSNTGDIDDISKTAVNIKSINVDSKRKFYEILLPDNNIKTLNELNYYHIEFLSEGVSLNEILSQSNLNND